MDQSNFHKMKIIFNIFNQLKHIPSKALVAQWVPHSRLTPSFWKCSQGQKDKTPIIDKKAKVPWIILVRKLFQNVG